MSLITEKHHKEKLNDYGINIKTKYIVGNKILERNTDNSINDDIYNGVRCEKQYYLKKKLIHTEKCFDSRIEYTFISKNMENMDYSCPNCGMSSKIKYFMDGCPYCKTHYNIDYTDKDLGSKYHYDRVLKSNVYRIVTAIVDLIISLIISFVFIKLTSRTFNSYDISKVFIYGVILSFILYYLFYIVDAYFILGPIKKYKDKQNQKQIDFWNRIKIDKKVFFNNLNYEIRKYYYSSDNIIDYDIIDYIDFKDFIRNDKLYIQVVVEIRVITINNNKLKSKIIKDTFIMKKNETGVLDLKSGINIIKCSNCGASIDATEGECKFCHSKIKYLQEWILDLGGIYEKK